MALPVSCREVFSSIEGCGYWFSAAVSPGEAEAIIQGLGIVLLVTDVTVRPGKALVTSDQALDYHTDHHRADFICWHCIEQTDQGGETMLLDSYQLLAGLPPATAAKLRQIQLHEHKVFNGDQERFPLLSKRFDRDKLYYSFWMLKGGVQQELKAAFMEFKRLTEEASPIRFKLQPGDFLIIDNGRMLHGRTAIQGHKPRHLRRFWIAKPNPNEGEPHASIGNTGSYFAEANQPA